MITEKLIQFIWQHKLFDATELKTVHHEPIVLIKQGFLNQYDGPDFSDARIKIGELEWAGTVEIHVKDIDWLKHGHQFNDKYKNVILHVVWSVENHETVPKGIPCLILKNHVSATLLLHYQSLLESSTLLSCTNYLEKIKEIDKQYTLSQHAFLRLTRKANEHYQILESFGFDWKQMLFYLFALALGKKVNKEVMGKLGKHLEIKHLLKYSDQEKTIEAFVFGTAGLLNNSNVSYEKELQNEYLFLKQKHSLQELNSTEWNFSKVRGASKPHVSLAVLVGLIKPISELEEIESVGNSFLNTIDLPIYWQEHYQFDKKTTKKHTISQDLKNHFKINTLVPYLSLLSKYYGDESYLYKAQAILEELKSEKNSIINSYTSYGFVIDDAFLSQGAIELYNQSCKHKKCLDCHTGKTILGWV